MMIHDVPLDCINNAAVAFHVPAAVILSVMAVEGGKNGMVTKNKNGTDDLGVMQINSSWLTTLKAHHITKSDLQNDPCLNVTVGTWILAHDMAERKGWQGIANYHSKTKKYNLAYQQKVQMHFNRIDTVIREDEA